MGRDSLHETVARAIADAEDGHVPGARHKRAAAVAIRVVLAEAQCVIKALDWHIAGEGPPWEDDPLLIDRSEALAVLAALGDELEPQPPV